MSASVFVPSGRPDQASGGETFWPSQVYCEGIMPPSSKAVLVSLSVILSTPFAALSTLEVGAGVAAASVCVVPPFWHAARKKALESSAPDASAVVVESVRLISPPLLSLRFYPESQKAQ